MVKSLIPIDHQLTLVRVGSVNDGGYLLPKECFNVNAVFSAGVEYNSDFEYEFAIKDIPCFLADYSVESPPISHPNLIFTKKFIGNSNLENEISLEHWIEDANTPSDNNLLSMDIEGNEYKILQSVSEDTLNQFTFITIELHNLAKILNNNQERMIIESLAKLKKNHHVVHVHANNFSPELHVDGKVISDVVEVSLIKKDFFGESKFEELTSFPIHTNDRPNDPLFRQYQLHLID